MAGSRQPGPICVPEDDPIDEGTMCLAATPAPRPVNAYQLADIEAMCRPQPDAAEADGVSIVLTPLQLAAVLEGGTLDDHPSLSTRLWGAVTIVGGALEMAGAGLLFAVPEPTMATKVAGGVLGVHGADTAAAGVRQLISGQTTTTLTADAAQTIGELLGADEATARRIGVAVDVGVPLVVGLAGAVRVLAVRRGAISLAAEEAAGGHAIARHVGKTETELLARLAAQPGITAASSFRTLAQAERFVSEAVRANRAALHAWAKTAPSGATKTIVHETGRVIGSGIVRGTPGLRAMTRVVVVVRRVQQRDRIYFVLTAYPKL
jgi:hypothetical protein